MSCAASRELLIEYSLGELDTNRARDVREHLQGGCEMCAKELAEIDESWARMAATLKPVSPSPEVEAKLLAMIRGTLPAVTKSEVKVSRQRSRVAAHALAASLIGIAAGWWGANYTPLAGMLARQQPDDDTAETWGAAPGPRSTAGLQTVALNTIAEKGGVRVSVVVAPRTKEWHVIAKGLPAIEDGEKLQLWLEKKSGEFSKAAVLPPQKAGRAGVVVDMDEMNIADLAAVWLTQEAVEVPARPSEVVLFRAAIR
jgi:hypothetical protein